MDKNYKVAICGAHSQGKTTLVNKLKEVPILTHDLKFSFNINLTRNLSKLLPINEAGDSASQYLIMARHLEFALTPGRWLWIEVRQMVLHIVIIFTIRGR